VAAVVGFAMLYSPGPPRYTLTAESLTIHDRFYPLTVSRADVDVEHIRVVDIGTDPEWRPVSRTNGFANAHYRSGWFRVAGGQKARMYWADAKRLVLLPPKGPGAAVLFEAGEPDQFVRDVGLQWSKHL
jgi:Bacterial PH domain